MYTYVFARMLSAPTAVTAIGGPCFSVIMTNKQQITLLQPSGGVGHFPVTVLTMIVPLSDWASDVTVGLHWSLSHTGSPLGNATLDVAATVTCVLL